jgi:CTP:molybdopterin cytidylyltransferase MocA
LEQAKAAQGFSESLVYLMRSVERDTRADLPEVCDMPEPDTVNHQTRGGARRNA